MFIVISIDRALSKSLGSAVIVRTYFPHGEIRDFLLSSENGSRSQRKPRVGVFNIKKMQRPSKNNIRFLRSQSSFRENHSTLRRGIARAPVTFPRVSLRIESEHRIGAEIELKSVRRDQP